MLVKERVSRAIESLSEDELLRVAEFLEYLKYRQRMKPISNLDLTQMADLYAEFGDEDRSMAEDGMNTYVTGLQSEDSK